MSPVKRQRRGLADVKLADDQIEARKGKERIKAMMLGNAMLNMNRIEELAAMLGSSQAEKAMFNGAGKLLRKAQAWKEREKEPVPA